MAGWLVEKLTQLVPAALRFGFDLGYRDRTKRNVLRSLVILNMMCVVGGFLGHKASVNKYFTLVGVVVAFSVYKAIGRIPNDQQWKVVALSISCFFQWMLFGTLVPDAMAVAMSPLLPPVGGLSHLVGGPQFQYLLEDEFIICSLIGAFLHSSCIWSANEWAWLPLGMQSSHLCIVVTMIWAIASACIFGGKSIAWLLSMFVVNSISMLYALAYEHELTIASGVGSEPYAVLVFGYLTYGPRKIWKAVVTFLFKKLFLAFWNLKGRRVFSSMFGEAT